MAKKQEHSKDRKKLLRIAVVLALLIFTLGLYAFSVWRNDRTIEPLIMIAILATIITFGAFFVKKAYLSVKKGFPLEDERSRKVMVLALARAYLITLYWLLAIGWASDDWIKFRDVSQATGLGILGMAIIFGLCWLYYNRKPDIN